MSFNILKNKILFKKYKIEGLLGKGSFGCVFRGINLKDNSELAIKVERKDAKSHLLEIESNFLSILKGYGIPEIKSYGRTAYFYVLVEEILGPNLTNIKNKQSFTLKDISMIAIQIIDRIEYIHSKNIIHRDIKPENFTIGYKNQSTIYIIDFGISKKYKSSRTGKHVKYSLTGKLFGTVRYISYNASRGVQQSRRDDLESIGYMLIYLCNGKLPWQGLGFKDINARKKYLEMLYLKKFTPPEIICKGLPIEFVEYIKYCKNLTFEQTPDYEYLRNRFRTILLKMNQINDLKFTWLTKINIQKQNKNLKTKILDKKETTNTNTKYINLLRRKQSPQTRLYRAIQHSLEKDDKSIKSLRTKSELSCEEKNLVPNKKINIDIYDRGISEDGLRNKLNNSYLSKDIISYNSHLAQYNMNVLGFQDEKKIYQLYLMRRRNRISKISFSPSPSPYNYPKNNSNILINCTKNKFDYKSTDYSTKNISKENLKFLSYKKHKNQNKIFKKRFNYSIDLDKNFFKENLNIIKNKIHSQSELIKNNKTNKKILPNDKRRTICENIYKNAINKIRKSLNNENIERKKDYFSYNIKKNQNSKNNKISQNLINKFNQLEDSFSFRNKLLDKNIKMTKINEYDMKKNNNKNVEIQKNIPKIIQKNNNNVIIQNKLNKNLINNKIFKIIRTNNAIKKAKINSDNINFNINSFLENKSIKNKRGINIIINNNVNSFSKNSLNERQNFIKPISNSENYNLMKGITERFDNQSFKSNNINNNNEIIENDYRSYHYINKIPKNKTKQMIKLVHYTNNCNNINSQKLNHYNPIKNIQNNENNYSNLSNNNLMNAYNVKKLPNKRNIQLLEYKPINKNNIVNNLNNLSQLNRYNNNINSNIYNENSFIQQENSFLLGKMRVIKLNNNTQNNPNQIKTQQKYYSNSYNNSDKILLNNKNNINKRKMIIKNNKIILGNLTHRNNFSNDVESYNIKKQNLMHKNGKIYLKNGSKIYQRLSPNIIKNKNFLDYGLDKGIDDNRGVLSYRSNSNNTKKKGLDFNKDTIEDFEYITHIPKNINNLNTKVNRYNGPKCFNSLRI